MSDVTPAGPIGLAMHNLRRLLAASDTWQEWTGADQSEDPAAAAQEHAYLVGLPAPEDDVDYTRDELEKLRPYAFVDLVADDGGGRDFAAERVASMAFVTSGRLALYLCADVPDELAHDFAGAKLDFLNRVGAVVAEMLSQAGIDGHLAVQRIALTDGPARSAKEEQPTLGDFFVAVFEVQYGP